MQETKKLIEKFWNGNANEVEKRQLLEYITDNEPEWKKFLETEYGKDLDDVKNSLTDSRAGKILAQLHLQIGAGAEKKKTILLHFSAWFKWAAAAILIIVAGLGIYKNIYNRSKNEKQMLAAQQASKEAGRLKHQTNTGKTVMRLQLEDGSLIRLQPNSSVSYCEPFETNRRTIHLEGEAFF